MSIPALPKALTVGELIQALAVYPSSARVWIPKGSNKFDVATGAFRTTPGDPFGGDVVLKTRPEADQDLRGIEKAS
jgi:hypothetical protein